MSLERKAFVESFARDALDEHISLFFGAGSSCSVGYPSWRELFIPLAKELNIATDDFTDYYKMAQYYANTYGDEELRRKLKASFKLNNKESDLLNEALSIGFSNVYTTNFDCTIEDFYKRRGVYVNILDSDSVFSEVDLKEHINVIKMNGDERHLTSAVITQNDYENYVDTHKVMLTFFKRDLISSTFLFVGYSFTDHLVLDCLSELNRYLKCSAGHHYAIIPDKPKDDTFKYFVSDLEKRYNVHVLVTKDYNEVPYILADINQKIREKKVFISGAFSSFESQIENFSHNFARSVSESLLKEKYRIINGIGRRFGTHLIGYANSYLAKNGTQNIERHLIITPFVGNSASSQIEKKKARTEVIKQCNAAIFVFGEADGNSVDKTSGVWEEFEISKEQHKVIIPISYKGMISEKIWNTVNDNITEYPYLEGKLDKLTYNNSPDLISQTILEILRSVQSTNM